MGGDGGALAVIVFMAPLVAGSGLVARPVRFRIGPSGSSRAGPCAARAGRGAVEAGKWRAHWAGVMVPLKQVQASASTRSPVPPTRRRRGRLVPGWSVPAVGGPSPQRGAHRGTGCRSRGPGTPTGRWPRRARGADVAGRGPRPVGCRAGSSSGSMPRGRLHVVAVDGQQPGPGGLFEEVRGVGAVVEFVTRYTALGVLCALAQGDKPWEQPSRGLLLAVAQGVVERLCGLRERAFEATCLPVSGQGRPGRPGAPGGGRRRPGCRAGQRRPSRTRPHSLRTGHLRRRAGRRRSPAPPQRRARDHGPARSLRTSTALRWTCGKRGDAAPPESRPRC